MAETWETIADWYAELLRSGSALNDFARDILLAVLPSDLQGVRVLDVGCGEGMVTRAVASRGADVIGVDPTARLIAHARTAEESTPTGARYAVDDGCSLATVPDASVDWVTAGLSLHHVPDLTAAVRAIHRVLAPAGRLAFTIPHPCFETPDAAWTDGEPSRRLIGDYLTERFWRSDNTGAVRRAGNRHRTLSGYVMPLIEQGFSIETLAEPPVNARIAAEQPHRAGIPPFLLVGARRDQ